LVYPFSVPGLGRRGVRSWFAPLVLLLSTACTVGPNYKKPPVTTPTAFKEQPAADSTLVAEWRVAQPADDLIRAKWWEAFNDPILNSFEEQVAVSNQTVAQAEAQFRAARAAVRGARADLYPTLTAGVAVTRSSTSANRSQRAGDVISRDTSDYQLPLDLTYEVDLWGRVRRNIESNVATAQASGADVQTALLSSQAELAMDYFQLRGLDTQVALLETTVAAYERALQLTRARYDQGVASGVDVAQAQTQLDTTRVQTTDRDVERAQFEHAIAILVGKAPADVTIARVTTGTTPPVIPVTLPSALLERRPDVAAAERRVASANAQIGVATAAYFPTLGIGATGGLESAEIATLLALPSHFWSIGPSLVATIFDGGKRRAAKEQAVANYDTTVAVYRQSVLTAFQDVEDNLAALKVLADEQRQAADAVASADRSLELANNRYRGGVTTYLEVITAQTAALANQITSADILTRRMTASVLLIKALGGGWSVANLPNGNDMHSTPSAAPRSDGSSRHVRSAPSTPRS
jgi:NodT family efflux transporter outer membrane factor (OMF) lipoprotein